MCVCDVSPRFLTCLVSTFRSIILHPICSLRARIPFLQFFPLSALISYFCSTINVTSLFFSLFFFPIDSPHKSFLPLSISLLLPSFILFSVLLPLSFFFIVLFIPAAAVFAFIFSFSLTQWHISVDVAVFESSSSFSFQVFVFSCVVIVVIFFQ